MLAEGQMRVEDNSRIAKAHDVIPHRSPNVPLASRLRPQRRDGARRAPEISFRLTWRFAASTLYNFERRDYYWRILLGFFHCSI